MILYYFPIAQNTGNKTVGDFFSERSDACICLCTYFTILLFYYSSLINFVTLNYEITGLDKQKYSV